MFQCLPYAVGHGDEGICLLVMVGDYRILLDCGLRNLQALIDPAVSDSQTTPQTASQSLPADVVLCSHAHADHARSLLPLHFAFPHLPIYASEVTTHLLPLNWLDQAPVPWFCQALPWRSPIEILDNLTVQLFPAGHLPGSAAILLTYTGGDRPYQLFYSGDFFLSNARLAEGLKLEELRGIHPDVLIIEGSYGAERHPRRRRQENDLMERMERAISNGQSILLPVSPFGLAQELLMLLRSHYLFSGRNLDIWVEGQVAQGCDVYLELLPHLPAPVQNFAQYQPLFWDDRISPRVRRLSPDQRSSLGQEPCIVLTDAISELSEFFQPHTSWLILLPQHQDLRLDWLSSEDRSAVSSEAAAVAVETYLLAEHCDGLGAVQLIHNLRPQHVMFVHGAPQALHDLAGLDELSSRYKLYIPSTETVVEFAIGETFLQPEAPELSYEGEVAETQESIVITLPETMTTDPRWRMLSDTGLVEAKWLGEQLIVRGITPRELHSENIEQKLESVDRDCCINCRYYQNQRCNNRRSPLFNFRVTPDGYCPAFALVMG
ncbi:MAG: hypothetical protein B0A82_15770 [Alkalinema sp. CACIAM 70d]|nr:MAG: hypothetical protein B0A82_15770 [Alkalinema sp. CACIAM 70d]